MVPSRSFRVEFRRQGVRPKRPSAPLERQEMGMGYFTAGDTRITLYCKDWEVASDTRDSFLKHYGV
jgi:hypothetical protein